MPRYKFVDFDEFGMTMEKCNRTGGWALKVFRVRKDGHYHFGAKINVIFAIEPGDPRLPPRMSVEVYSVLGVGFSVFMVLGQQQIFSATSAIESVQILSSMELQAQMIIVFLFGTTSWLITLRMYIRL